MEELAKKISREINDICVGYLYLKQTDVIEKILPLTKDIQEFLASFLRGNLFGIKEEDYRELFSYATEVAADYVEAVGQRDMVLMVDTLDYGLRELLNIYAPLAEEEDHDRDI